MLRSITMIEKEVVDLKNLKITEPSSYEKEYGDPQWSQALEINLTDGTRLCHAFGKVTTERDVIDALRELATMIENRDGGNFQYLHK